MTKDYMQPFNPPGRSYLTGILKGCRQNQIPTESDPNRTNPESSQAEGSVRNGG